MKLTPLMQQWTDIKASHPDEIILFRMGDFYEMFDRDAEVAAPLIGIALTQRNKKAEDSTKMCGVPHHSIAGPIAKLLAAGQRVAIVDQMEDPATAKGIVKRAVTRVLTPGMVYDPDTLDQLSANYIAAFDDTCVAFADITTGEAFQYTSLTPPERDELLSLLQPVELVLTSKQSFKRPVGGTTGPLISLHDGEMTPSERLKAYVEKLQGAETARTIANFETRQRQTALRISSTSLKHLEVFHNSQGEAKGSLFHAIHRTQTSAGARLLKSWLMHPLTDINAIHERQEAIALWLKVSSPLKTFRQKLGQMGDVERRLGKLNSTTFNARDLMAIAESLRVGIELTALHPENPKLQHLDRIGDLVGRIEATLNEELPHSIKDGGLIRRGVVAELDELMDTALNAQKHLADFEAREKEATGIASLKVRYNNVFGFYIELTSTHAHKAPKHYRRKQTLANAERFTTDELDRLEEKILSSQTKRDQLELEIFLGLKGELMNLTLDILDVCRQWTRWDVLTSLAWLSLERGYVRPRFSETGRLHLELSRHPVVEQNVEFVPNTVSLAPGGAILLTGPNMAGKSTLMRQVALIALLAQIGSNVPASSAELPLFDAIYTRLGASDALSEGLSTFMVEMTETSQILKRATSRSLVIMDEIGRGTSTYDGLSLAQAILEHMVTELKAYLLFATHYHELTRLQQIYPQLHNAHMTVSEKNGQIQFLHTLVAGPANRSYGIHVARLAGLPGPVTQRAQGLLKGFEGFAPASGQLSFLDMPTNTNTDPTPESLPEWLKDFQSLDLSRMTPLEALNKLYEWQQEVSS